MDLNNHRPPHRNPMAAEQISRVVIIDSFIWKRVEIDMCFSSQPERHVNVLADARPIGSTEGNDIRLLSLDSDEMDDLGIYLNDDRDAFFGALLLRLGY